MRVLFDINVILDLLLDREPFSVTSAELISRVEKGEITGYICATGITTIHYLATKVLGAKHTRKEIQKLLSLFEVAQVNRAVLKAALDGKFPDFEDAVAYESARHVNAEAIVTRNAGDFKHSIIPAYSPSDFLKILRVLEISHA